MSAQDVQSCPYPTRLTDAAEPAGEDGHGEAEETSNLLIYVLFLLGSFLILRFVRSELALARAKRRSCGSTLDFTSSELFQYRLDYYFSTSKFAKPVLLLSATFVLIVVGAVLLTLVVPGQSVQQATWVAWTYVADPGTHADCAETLAVRFVSFCITIGGMLVFALMIGIISETISEKVDDLKRGTSRVIESDHTLMLGWSDKSLAIIGQIALANESEGGGTIVVLADVDKDEMESKLLHATEASSEHERLHLLGTVVVFRSGNPLLEHELRRVSVITARAVIVLSSPHVTPDEADSTAVRQVLALKAVDGVRAHVVVEMQDVDNRGLVRQVAGEADNVEVIVAHDIIGRLMIQCAREPGLAHVLENLLGFEGSEFYVERWPELVGQTFRAVTCRFDDAVVVGVKRGSDGKMCINPPDEYLLRDGDRILCLAEDNDTYSVNDGTYSLKQGTVPTMAAPTRGREKLLFCGWRRDMADMITELDEYVERGSELWLFNMVPVEERAALLTDKDNKDEVRTSNLKIKNAVGNPVVRRNLLSLRAVDGSGRATGESTTLDEFDSILILSDEDAPDMESSDSRSLASLLIIQELQRHLLSERCSVGGSSNNNGGGGSGARRSSSSGSNDKAPPAPQAQQRHSTPRWSVVQRKSRGEPSCYPISEILDTRTRSLLQVAGCRGYVMSNHIVSLWLAQVAEDRDMNVVLGELLSAEGCETYIRDVSYYLDLRGGSSKQATSTAQRSFWDVAVLARQRREVAVGYKPRDMTWQEASDLILNPPDKATPRKWEEGDVVLVFAFN